MWKEVTVGGEEKWDERQKRGEREGSTRKKDVGCFSVFLQLRAILMNYR